MKRFSISSLLWLVCIVSIVVTITMTQNAIRKSERSLLQAQLANEKYRDELGKIDLVDPEKHHIRHWDDLFESDLENRWRIYVPDSSRCQFFFSTGNLPKNGVPEEGQKLSTQNVRPGATEFVLSVECRQHQGELGDLRIEFYTDGDETIPEAIDARGFLNVDWLPGLSDTCEGPPEFDTTVFELDQPFTIIKHYKTEPNGELTGYMFWME